MTPLPGVPARFLQIECDLRLAVRAVEDPVTHRVQLSCRLERRSPADVTPDGFMETAAGFLLGLHRADDFCDAVRGVALRAAQAAAMAPLG